MIAALLLAAASAPVPTAERHATGHFAVSLAPAAAAERSIPALAMAKTFRGGIAGTAAGEMLSVGDPAAGAAAYVAVERVTGTVDGRHGSFALIHRGVIEPGRPPTLDVTVAPGSGTGELSGIAGTMTIDPARDHAYDFRYTLPAR